MNYIRVQWLHKHLDDPIWLISELNEARMEVRKVEIFADGSKGFASEHEENGGTRLGHVPVPPLDEIAAQPEFVPEQISEEMFEAIWAARMSSP